MSTRGVVAAGHPYTAEAGAEILRAGGNAFDAAVAAFFMACVAEPVLASLGGGGFLLARDARGDACVFDFFTQTPGSRARPGDLDFYPVLVDFGSAQQEFHVGLGASAVPGCVRGVFDVHRRLGRIPMPELVKPAVEAARAGLEVNPLQAYIFTLVEPIYMTDSAGPLFASRRDPARVATEGETLRFQDLADTLELLAREGDGFFYCGEIADKVARMCAEGGGHLSRRDFENYGVVERHPLRISYRDAQLLLNPPPSAGGALIAFGLRLLEEVDVVDVAHDVFAYLRLLVEVMLQTSSARLASMAESEAQVGGSRIAQLLGDPLLHAYKAEVLRRYQTLRGTTHISVIDAGSNIATMTVSNGEGCGRVIPHTGCMLNNMLGEEDVNPVGFHRWHVNQRMSSMMAPTVALFADGRTIAAGSGGSNRIRTALLQLLVNLIDLDMDLEQAVRAPRIHIEDEVLNVEGGVEAEIVEKLIAEFPQHRVFDELNLFFGGTHTVERKANGGLGGEGDPRRGGVCTFVAGP